MGPESIIQKRIERSLPLFCPEVVYIDRLNSGTVRVANRFMRLCKRGTPDMYAIIDHDGGHFLFIEVKGPKGRQSFEQKRFMHMVKDLKNVHYVVARETADVLKYIQEHIFKGENDGKM